MKLNEYLGANHNNNLSSFAKDWNVGYRKAQRLRNVHDCIVVDGCLYKKVLEKPKSEKL